MGDFGTPPPTPRLRPTLRIGERAVDTTEMLLGVHTTELLLCHIGVRLTQRKQGNKGRRRGRVKDVAKARVDEVRDAFAQLVLALLRVPAPDVQRQIVSTRGLVRGVIHLVASSNSGPSLPIVALSTLLTCVVRNAGVPSHAKRKVLDGSTLEVVTRLYASGGAVRDDDEERGRAQHPRIPGWAGAVRRWCK